MDLSKMEALLTCLFNQMSPDNQQDVQEVKGSGGARLCQIKSPRLGYLPQ